MAETTSPMTFLKTHKGMIMAGEIALCLGAMIGKIVPVYHGCNISVPIAEMIFGVLMMRAFTSGLDKTSFEVHWLFCDFLRAVTGSTILLLSSGTCLMLLIQNSLTMLIAGEVFGLCAGGLFFYDSFVILSSIKTRSQSS